MMPGQTTVAEVKRGGDGANRIIMLDYLRGLSALAVAWFHLTGQYYGSWVLQTGHYGRFGVECFFVISGFVIPFSMYRCKMLGPGEYLRFIARRLVRIEIPFAVNLGLVILLWYASSLAPNYHGEPFRIAAGQTVLNLVYLIPFTGYDWFNPVYWTLAYEFAFYLALGLLFEKAIRREEVLPWLVAVGCLLAAIAYGLLTYYFALFAMGVAVFRGAVNRDSNFWTISVIAASLSVMIWKGGASEGLAGALTAAAIRFLSDASLPNWWAGGLGWLGKISYSLYLIHAPIGGRVVNFGMRFIHSDVGHLALSLVALGASLSVAWLFWKLVERPCHELARSIPQQSPAGLLATQ